MSKTQIILAIVLVLAIVALFLPWVGISGTIDGGEWFSTTNYGYNYIVPLSAATPVGILCIIGFILSAYSFKAKKRIGDLNITAGILILIGLIAAFAYTSRAAMAAVSIIGGSVNLSVAYGMGLEILFGVLMIIFGARAEPDTAVFYRRRVKDFRFSVLPVPGRVLAIIFFIFLFTFPLITKHPYYMDMMIYASIFAIFAVSWDLLSGYTGLVNFGHALFFGVAAYTSALLCTYAHWPLPATMIVGVLAAVVAGVATCFPALRLRGPYLSLLTLAFPLMLLGIVMFFKGFTGAEYGLPSLPLIATSRVDQYYICVIVMTVAVLIMWKFTDAGSRYIRTGLIFHAIREDEIAARATGINTIRYKLLAFVIGGFFAGVAGVLYAHVRGLVSPAATLGINLSFEAIIWVIFGGVVSIYGAVVGVYVLFPLVYFSNDAQSIFEYFIDIIPKEPAMAPFLSILDFLREVAARPILLLAVIVILVLLFMPEGLAVLIRDKIERECPRCKLTNGAWRRDCRACGASLRLAKP